MPMILTWLDGMWISLKKTTQSWTVVRQSMDLKSTKYMVTSSSRYRSPNQMLEVGGKHFEEVNSFVYLGSLVNSENNIGEEIRRRVTLGNRSFYSLQKLFRSKTLHRNLKCQLYRSLVGRFWHMDRKRGA